MALVSNRVDRWLSVRASLIVVALVVSGATPFSSKPALAIEPVQRIVSPGGIEALLIESHEVGLISMRISFRGGAVQDPADKPGVAYFTGYMFNEGAGDLSPRRRHARPATRTSPCSPRSRSRRSRRRG